MTWEGYHYVLVASTTNATYTTIQRAISNETTSIAVASAWSTSTISGYTLPTTAFLIGGDEDEIYIATSTISIAKFTVATSTNTLTYSGQYNLSSTNILLTNTRVNRNGMYIGYSAAPFTRKFTLNGVAVSNIQNTNVAVPSTTGPDMFATPYSLYSLNGNSTTYLTKLLGY
jgi:hypothetical protein